jgi:hypothetical protein
MTSLHSNDLVYELGINALAKGNKKDCAGQAKTNGNDSDQGPSAVTPYGPPGESGYHNGTPVRSRLLFALSRLGTKPKPTLRDSWSCRPWSVVSGPLFKLFKPFKSLKSLNPFNSTF